MNRRRRLAGALLAAVLITAALFFYAYSIEPHYFLTFGNRLSILTPSGFSMGQHYDFSDLSYEAAAKTQGSGSTGELVLPRPDNRMIVFKYPEVVKLGRPSYLGSDITQSVDFTVTDPKANGLIQIWVLSTTLEEFLETSKNYSAIDYLSFESKKEKRGSLSYTLWDYTFKSGDKNIRALEAFYDDKPYMYRISIFIDNAEYSEKFQSLFDGIVGSVTVK